jgi:hypothetical protein
MTAASRIDFIDEEITKWSNVLGDQSNFLPGTELSVKFAVLSMVARPGGESITR